MSTAVTCARSLSLSIYIYFLEQAFASKFERSKLAGMYLRALFSRL